MRVQIPSSGPKERENEMYMIKMARLGYDDEQFPNEYAFRSFQDREPYATLEEAKSDLAKLRRATGKCYGIFDQNGDAYDVTPHWMRDGKTRAPEAN